MKVVEDKLTLEDEVSPKIIMPEEIKRIDTLATGVYQVTLIDGKFCILEPGNHRLDRPTGEKVEEQEIFENDRVKYTREDDTDFYEPEGTIKFSSGKFIVEWDDYDKEDLCYYDSILTIIGMEPFEDKL